VNTALKDQENSSPKIPSMALPKTTAGFFLPQMKYPTYEEVKPSLLDEPNKYEKDGHQAGP
jgi:hypothetical protein